MQSSLLILTAIAGGLAVALQAQFVGVMDKHFNSFVSVFITYVGGAVLMLLLLLFRRNTFSMVSLHQAQQLPWYIYGTGLLGLIIVGAIGYSTARLGATASLTLILASQMLAAALIEHFGLFGASLRVFDLTRALALVLLAVSVYLFSK